MENETLLAKDPMLSVGPGRRAKGRVTRWAFHCSEHGWAQEVFASKAAAERGAVSHRDNHE